MVWYCIISSVIFWAPSLGRKCTSQSTWNISASPHQATTWKDFLPLLQTEAWHQWCQCSCAEGTKHRQSIYLTFYIFLSCFKTKKCVCVCVSYICYLSFNSRTYTRYVNHADGTLWSSWVRIVVVVWSLMLQQWIDVLYITVYCMYTRHSDIVMQNIRLIPMLHPCRIWFYTWYDTDIAFVDICWHAPAHWCHLVTFGAYDLLGKTPRMGWSLVVDFFSRLGTGIANGIFGRGIADSGTVSKTPVQAAFRKNI